jgi:hypothetical protein
MAFLDTQQSDSARKPEPSRSRAARIDQYRLAQRFYIRAVSVPENEYIGSELFDQRAFMRPNLVKLAEYMADDHSATGDMFQALGGEAVEPVIIAFDGEDRRNPFELVDNLKLADIARVDN